MLDLTAADYAGYAESRLTRARRRFDLTESQSYTERRGELAQIASLVWDATIDMVSALALLNGVALTGRSSDMSDYAKRRLPDAYMDWPGPARLHNFQHKPNHPEPRFQLACRRAGSVLSLLNQQLPAHLQLTSECWEWLARPA
ncbi:MAG: hypothetical protein F4X64_09010 [Chloroflexi bacterium]|nr:hypothetical protein [Chloroflexota bacterium]